MNKKIISKTTLFVPFTICKKCFNNSNVVAFLVFVFYLNHSRVSTFSFVQNTRVLQYPKLNRIWGPPLTVSKQSERIKEMNGRMIQQTSHNFGVNFRSGTERSPRSYIHSGFPNGNRAMNIDIRYNDAQIARSINEAHILPTDTSEYG